MNNFVIIYILDLYVILYNKLNGKLNNKCDLYLIINFFEELLSLYVINFCEYIKK